MANFNYINRNNEDFFKSIKEFYIDKTNLITFTNDNLSSNDKLICVSRPRRFGKSITAKMLNAYYSKGCDSKELFSKFKIANTPDYEEHLNKYDVIYLDIQGINALYKSDNKAKGLSFISYIQKKVVNELALEFNEHNIIDFEQGLVGNLVNIYNALGNKFIFIIDEWDFVFREFKTAIELQNDYLCLLRDLFKNSILEPCIALAYMTGILPIKRQKIESGLNNFDEYTMLNPGFLAEFAGITEEEVATICAENNLDSEKVKYWYDGYELKGNHIYNPRAINKLVTTGGKFNNYWSDTGSFTDVVLPYITMNFDGLKEYILELLKGEELELDDDTFQNDLISFKRKEDVIVFLIHLGYIAYKQETRTVYIPNEEIRQELTKAIKETQWQDFFDYLKESQKAFKALENIDEEYVASFIEERHSKLTSCIYYNNENALSYVVRDAFIAAEYSDYYAPEREAQSGKGFADLVYIPRSYRSKSRSVVIIELKYDKSADIALQQILDKKYYEKYKTMGKSVLMVGINYDKATKKHSCRIQKYEEDL
jgi:hypothetical protein